MKLFTYSLLAIVLLAVSCTKEIPTPDNKKETDELKLVKTFTNATHSVNLYTENGKIQQGYNKIYLQIKNSDGTAVNNANASWKPLMHMMNMSHACPYSAISKSSGRQSLLEGYIIFQMAGNASEYWELEINYTIGGKDYTAKNTIDVPATDKRNVASFKGSDNVNYIIALVSPSSPKVAVNDMQAMIFRMQDMLNFPVVNNYRIKIDPRMPGMGNHSSPNSVDLTQNTGDKNYYGKLSLTMTGYWRINLQLQNEAGAIVKGEPVTATNESSSIFFEIEF
ncbi:FixH family protein [Niabella yanshanensis]|uniref:FixH family protein n=1 Tax=Niabella yanshanensis TaxID=577386 RepID=A0ABZ0WC25_9BACT|nr:FixH family protein [Niabella yanshanensis]WQD40243.1 FixH family protein [Niabella yanshanensis]